MNKLPPPLVFQHLLDMTSVGISTENCTFSTLTMESDKFICVRELMPNNETNVVIINMEKPNAPVRHAISADSAIMNPNKFVLALRLGQTMQIFDIGEKVKLNSYVMQEQVVYWRWLSTKEMVLVTTKAVYHWEALLKDAEPMKVFERMKELNQSMIVSYKVDREKKWMSLVGLSHGPQTQPLRVMGQVQLYSMEKGMSQSLEGHAVTFMTCRHPMKDMEVTLFCVAIRRVSQSQLLVRQVSHRETELERVDRMIDLYFPQEVQGDFPIALEVDERFESIYMLTKMGYLHIYDVNVGRLISINRLLNEVDTIFVAVPWRGGQGVMACSGGGKVLGVSLDAQALVRYLLMKNEMEMATMMSWRMKSRETEQLSRKTMEMMMEQGRVIDAAKWVCKFPNEWLRTRETLEALKRVMVLVNGEQQPAILQYFGVIMESGKLNEMESVEMVRLVLQRGRKDLLVKWLKEEKLESSEELGDMMVDQDLKMALSVYVKSESREKVIRILAEQGKHEQLMGWYEQQWMNGVEYDPNWLKVLNELYERARVQMVPLAVKLVKKRGVGKYVSREEVMKEWQERGYEEELMNWLQEVVMDVKEDGEYQMKLLELMMKYRKELAKEKLMKHEYTYLDELKVSKLCEREKWMKYALEYAKELEDRKRILKCSECVMEGGVGEEKITVSYLLAWFAELEPKDALECMKEMMEYDWKRNGEVVLVLAHHYWQVMDGKKLKKIFDGLPSSELKYRFLLPLWNRVEEVEWKEDFLLVSAKRGEWMKVEEVVMSESGECMNGERVMEELMDMGLDPPRALLICSKRYGKVEKLVKYLYERGQMEMLKEYVREWNQKAMPKVCEVLMELEASDELLSELLWMVVGEKRVNVKEVIEVFEGGGRVNLMKKWLERKKSEELEEEEELVVYTMLGKLCVGLRNMNEMKKFLEESEGKYDELELGEYCEERDPMMSCMIYGGVRGEKGRNERAKERMMELVYEMNFVDWMVRYVIDLEEEWIWKLVMKKYPREGINVWMEKCMEVLKDERKSLKRKWCMVVSIWMDVKDWIEEVKEEVVKKWSEALWNLLESVLLEGVRSDVNGESMVKRRNGRVETLWTCWLLMLVEGAMEDWKMKWEESVKKVPMEKVDVDQVTKMAMQMGREEVAFEVYNRSNRVMDALMVLLTKGQLDRAEKYVLEGVCGGVVDERMKEMLVVKVGEYQLKSGRLKSALKNWTRVRYSGAYQEVISMVTREMNRGVLEEEEGEIWKVVSEYLTMVRERQIMERGMVMDQKLELEWLYSKAMEGDLESLNSAVKSEEGVGILVQVGERLYAKSKYNVAKMIFEHLKMKARLAQTCLKMGDLEGALDNMLNESKVSHLWRELFILSMKDYKSRISKISAMNLLLLEEGGMGSDLELVIGEYHRLLDMEENVKKMKMIRDDWFEIVEKVIRVQGPSMLLVNEMVILMVVMGYDEKLRSFVEEYCDQLNGESVGLALESAKKWKIVLELYYSRQEWEKYWLVILDHPMEEESSYDWTKMTRSIQGCSFDIQIRALDWIRQKKPNHLCEVLISSLSSSSKFDWKRIVSWSKSNHIESLLFPYWKQWVSSGSAPFEVYNIFYDLLVEFEDLDELHNFIYDQSTTNNHLSNSSTNHFGDLTRLAEICEKHPRLEFRRFAARLWSQNCSNPTRALDLLLADKLHQSAIDCAATSNDTLLAQKLVQHYLISKNVPALISTLNRCYSLLPSHIVLELVWKYGQLDHSVPYWIQFIHDLTSKVDQIGHALLVYKNIIDHQLQNSRLNNNNNNTFSPTSPLSPPTQNFYPQQPTFGHFIGPNSPLPSK